MTDQPKPDRPDGDGLLPCPFCGNEPEHDKGEDHVRHFSEARIWCEDHECIGPATTAAHWKDALIQWNTRATPPSSNGAEGANKLYYDFEVSRLIRESQTVPQQSAPDAMREALRRIIQIDQREERTTVEIDPAGNTYDIKMVDGPLAKIARDAISTLVPLSDGAGEIPEAALWALIGTLHENVPEDDRPMSWSDFSNEQANRLKRAATAFLRAWQGQDHPRN